jgi:hypothetical protein
VLGLCAIYGDFDVFLFPLNLLTYPPSLFVLLPGTGRIGSVEIIYLGPFSPFSYERNLQGSFNPAG